MWMHMQCNINALTFHKMSGHTHYIGKVMMQERKTWRYGDFTADDAKQFWFIRRLDVSDNKYKTCQKTSQGQICPIITNS